MSVMYERLSFIYKYSTFLNFPSEFTSYMLTVFIRNFCATDTQ